MPIMVILVVKNSWEGYKIWCPMRYKETKDLTNFFANPCSGGLRKNWVFRKSRKYSFGSKFEFLSGVQNCSWTEFSFGIYYITVIGTKLQIINFENQNSIFDRAVSLYYPFLKNIFNFFFGCENWWLFTNYFYVLASECYSRNCIHAKCSTWISNRSRNEPST